MASNRIRRVAKELADIQSDKDSHIHIQPGDGSDMSHLLASFAGPPDTPYEGGTYVIDVKIPLEYPFRPPKMEFKTQIYHPNISSVTGAICLDTLGSAWSPVLTIKSALLSLQSLLNSPEPKDPQDAMVAAQMTRDPEEFAREARKWAVKWAGAPADPSWQPKGPLFTSGSSIPQARQVHEDPMAQYQGYNKDLIDRFVSMGFAIERVVEAFIFVAIDRNNGEDYELEAAYMGDITARLLGEP